MSVRQLFDLTGQVAVITGGSRGLGLQIAEALGEMGAVLALTARKQDELDDAVRALAAQGVTAVAFACDLARPEAVAPLVGQVMARFGRIDILVNNAGINPIWRTIEKTSLADFRAILDVNLTGTFLCCKYLGAAMAAAGSGAIVNMSSVAGHVGLTRSVPYCASKGGIEMLTKALAVEWATRGVRVNCLAPGYVDTDLTSGLLHHETLSKPFLDHTPMGRFGMPGDIAGAALFLASDAAAYMTGHSLVVDGGWTAH